MAYTLETIQEAIIAALDAALPQRIVEQAIPDIDNVERVNGVIQPYVAYQFGDIAEGRRRSFAGPTGHDYLLPFRCQAVAPTAKIARQISNRITLALLGEDFAWSGSMTKNRVGGMWPLVNSNNATEAYVFPSGFQILVQLAVTT